MFEKITQWLSTAPAPADPVQTRQLAMAVLLVEVGRADFDFDADERAQMQRLLIDGLHLSPEDARALLDQAVAESGAAVSLHGFIATLNAQLDADGKRRLLQALWQVAYADGQLRPQEEARIRQLAELLYVSDADFVRTRLRVAAQASDNITTASAV